MGDPTEYLYFLLKCKFGKDVAFRILFWLNGYWDIPCVNCKAGERWLFGMNRTPTDNFLVMLKLRDLEFQTGNILMAPFNVSKSHWWRYCNKSKIWQMCDESTRLATAQVWYFEQKQKLVDKIVTMYS
jgi:hypothetical protein